VGRRRATRGRELAPTGQEHRAPVADGPGTDAIEAACLSARERLRELLDAPQSLGVRFAIGGLVSRIKADPDAYGVGAVARLAASLDQDLTRLYRHGRVAECWTEAEAAQLLSQSPRGGRALTWSHLVTLAAIEGSRERARWTERARVEALSIRELAARLALQEPRDGCDPRVGRAIRTATRFLADCETAGIPSWGSAGRREIVVRALAVHERLLAVVGRRVAALRTALAASEESHVRSDPPGRIVGDAADGTRSEKSGSRRAAGNVNGNEVLDRSREAFGLKAPLRAGQGVPRE